jgi:alcohol dehydrogenase (cytochrome c)
VARPGEPGGNTWNDLPLEKRNGGSVWVTGSYDPALGLVYFGPAPTYDTAPLLEAVVKEGVTNEALFTNATVALGASTGKLAWYYQHVANDQWDLDWAFERQIVDLPIDGETRRAVVNVGKLAIVEANDAATGEYLFSIDLGLQNVIAAIDPETGRKTINPLVAIDLTQPRLICPTVVGARSWPPTSFDPESKMLYLPLTEGCNTFGPEGFKGLFTSGIGLSMTPHPVSSDGNMGRLQAVNLATRQMAWSYRQPTPLVSSTLATAGGVVFVGDLEPSLKAFDSKSGDLLWRGAIDDTPGSSLVTYAVDGRQYVAVVVGQTNNVVRDWSRIYRSFAEARSAKLAEPPKGGAAIWAFALPR